jgi:hypothetical protein
MLIILGLILLACFALLQSAVRDVLGGREQKTQQPVNVTIHNHITNITPEQARTNVASQEEEPIWLKR